MFASHWMKSPRMPELAALPPVADGDGKGTGDEQRAQLPDFRTLQPIAGVAINAHHITYLDWYLDGVDKIAELGGNALVLATPMWMENVSSSEIRFLENRCPTDEQLAAILTRAKQHGMTTMLLPVVLLEEAGERDWRGTIRPDDWDAWWKSYDAFLDRYIALANRAKVDILSIGSELNTTEPQVEHWQQTIKRVRSEYDGLLAYSANWDRYDQVTFWNDVDIMAVSSYFELARDGSKPDLTVLVSAWNVERDRLILAARRAGKPLLLSEVGYPSLPTAAMHPWNYSNTDGHKADHAAQALCYRAFFESWLDVITQPRSTALGFFCYAWDPYNHGGRDDTGYGITGKPSLEVIRRAFAKIRLRTTTSDR
ncbi:MAG: glycoside hydrolase family 113 [Phycisphaerales bacterium]